MRGSCIDPGPEESDPFRSFGIFRFRSPAVVVNDLDREPLRWVVLASERSNGAAQMTASPRPR